MIYAVSDTICNSETWKETSNLEFKTVKQTQFDYQIATKFRSKSNMTQRYNDLIFCWIFTFHFHMFGQKDAWLFLSIQPFIAVKFNFYVVFLSRLSGLIAFLWNKMWQYLLQIKQAASRDFASLPNLRQKIHNHAIVITNSNRKLFPPELTLKLPKIIHNSPCFARIIWFMSIYVGIFVGIFVLEYFGDDRLSKILHLN